ncbi:MAG TPA: type IV pilus secretin PilQ, partial [Burkholderiales bacterium]|nr:type IV pilus secretin PilQ [Burkholderiales bacterium]
PALNELAGQGIVKGVYPYLAENGAAVNVDILLNESGRLQVEKIGDGLRVTPVAGSPVAAPTAVPAPSPSPTANDKNVIQDILYAKLPGDRLQVTIKMSQKPPEPSAFSVTNPAQIAFDFPNTGVDLQKKTFNVKEGAVTNITAVAVDDRTRVVLKLIKTVAYRTAADGNNFVITVDAPVSGHSTTEQAKVTHFAGSRKNGKYALRGIDFRRGPQGDGKIIVTLSDPSVGIDIREQAGEVILDFADATVVAELQRRLDVVDFATPVQTIDTFVQGKNTRMVISPKGKYEHIAYQTGNVFTVSIKPVIERTDEKKTDEFGYSGEKLSLNFQNIEVRAALQVLADFTGLNFVVSDTVKGSLTVRLKDVPWDQALDLIVDSKGLAMRRKGNVLTIAPAPEVAAKEKAAFEAAKSNIELEPLVSELITISYAKADEIAVLLKSIKPVTSGGANVHPVFGPQATGEAVQVSTQSNTLLSPRGQVSVDARTNSLLIQDTPAKIREIRKLIAQLDQPVRQVMVETRLVEATDNYIKNLGARLGHIYSGVHNSKGVVTTGKTDDLPSSCPSGPPCTGPLDVTANGLTVNLAAAGAGSFAVGAFTTAFLKGGLNLVLELSALEQSGLGKIISSPRVITANQKKALIEQGQEKTFTTNVLGVGSVITKKATLKLEVTPQITPDDRVNLDVQINKDNFVAGTDLLNIKQITTQVLLDNGETVVIGGIFEQDKGTTITQVPFFGDIPLLGNLFKNKATRDEKTELLIFLTPRILSNRFNVR